jgi:hypothetical protein
MKVPVQSGPDFDWDGGGITMRVKYVFALVAAALAIGLGAGTAIASHVTQIDPATVPLGFLASHNQVAQMPEQLPDPNADVFVQHARLGPGGSTIWHTHPGPVIVTVVSGSLTYVDAADANAAGENNEQDTCRHRTYTAGSGFTDPGYGHVHRAVAGTSGADFYAVYILPRGSANHLIPASAPAPCL